MAAMHAMLAAGQPHTPHGAAGVEAAGVAGLQAPAQQQQQQQQQQRSHTHEQAHARQAQLLTTHGDGGDAGVSSPSSSSSTPTHQPPADAADVNAFQAMLRAQPRFVRELIAGGVAGGLAKTSIAPLERTKILLQTGQSGTMGIWGTLKFLWTTEGIRGMFRGNSASVLRIVPYAAIHFSAYEWYRRLIVEQYMAPDARTHTGRTGRHSAAAEGAGAGGGGVSSSSGANSRSSSVSSSGVVGASGRTLSASDPLVDLMAGSASGATAVLITYPLDLLRAQLAYSTALEGGSNGAPPRPLGLRGLVQRTLTEHGWSGLYRGVGPTLLGILPYAGIKFYVYTSLKLAYKAEYPGGAAPSAVDGGAPGAGPGGKLPVPVMLLFGGVSGLIAQTATYPLDLIRRRQQVDSITRHHSTAPHKAPTSISVLSSIVREHGMRGLFRGVSINYIKSVPSTAIGFTVYDQLKSYLGLHNHLA